MSGSIRRRARARQDLVETYRFLAREVGFRAADRFLTEAEACFRRLATRPRLGTRFEAADPAFGELRYFPLPARFKSFLVFYRVLADGIEIARVLHGARDLDGILGDEFDTPGGSDSD